MNAPVKQIRPRFIPESGSADWFKSNDSIYYCRFNVQYYNDIYYEQCIVHFPENIRKAVPKRRAEFLAGRFCAKRALESIMTLPPDIGIGANRNPIWPDQVIGSISHCDSSAVAVVSNSADISGIGIDIEHAISDTTIKNIRSQIVLQDEIKLFINSPLNDTTLFTIIFSLKESFFKAAYPRVKRYFDFDAVTVLQIEVKTQKILFRLNYDLHTSLQKGMLFRGEFHMIDEARLATLVTIPEEIIA